MEDPTEQLDRFAAGLAAFRPAQAPSPAAVHYAAGVHAGSRAAARRYAAVFAGLAMLCAGAVAYSARKSGEVRRLEASVATLRAEVLVAAAAPTRTSIDEPADASANADAMADSNSGDAAKPIRQFDTRLAAIAVPDRWRKLSDREVFLLSTADARLNPKHESSGSEATPSDRLDEPTMTLGSSRRLDWQL